LQPDNLDEQVAETLVNEPYITTVVRDGLINHKVFGCIKETLFVKSNVFMRWWKPWLLAAYYIFNIAYTPNYLGGFLHLLCIVF